MPVTPMSLLPVNRPQGFFIGRVSGQHQAPEPVILLHLSSLAVGILQQTPNVALLTRWFITARPGCYLQVGLGTKHSSVNQHPSYSKSGLL